jgi:uncharacterized membrane protein YphA (DoxX/SURF4 family)
MELALMKTGRALFGISVAGLAILCLVYGNFSPAVDPLPDLLPWPKFWEYGSGVTLLAASAGLFFASTALASAIIIGVCETIWAAARARPIFHEPLSVGSWYGVAEALGPLVGVWILYALLRREHGAPVSAMTGDRALRVARVLFGAACVVYGAAHFAYAAYTAKMVPAWLPSRMAIVYLTGAFHAAAGFGILFGILPRLAATLEAVMLTLFGVLVWFPSFFARPVPDWAPTMQIRCSETFVGFLLAGSAWIVAESLRNTPRAFAPDEADDSAMPAK